MSRVYATRPDAGRRAAFTGDRWIVLAGLGPLVGRTGAAGDGDRHRREDAEGDGADQLLRNDSLVSTVATPRSPQSSSASTVDGGTRP